MYLEPFGNIDTDNLEECYDSLLYVHGDTIEIDLNFEAESIENTELEHVKKFLSGIEAFSEKAFKAISDDFDLGEKSEVVRLYLHHHLEEFEEDTIQEAFGATQIDKQIFLNHLKLYRVGFYPEDDGSFAIFDIQFPKKYTDYLIAVTFDRDGKLLRMSMES
nr:DUF2004 domain-containing protein [uncultured Desulfobacter sp.]